MNFLLKCVLASAPLFSLGMATAADLTIQVDDVKNADGVLMVAIFNSEGSFLKQPVKGAGARAVAGTSTIALTGLPEGEIAFAIYHDANSNGQMDKNPMGIPTEDYAFSNNAMGKMGPPKYEAAKFLLPAAGATVRVSLK
ncbi:DUF2141 domain-containing protein [Massilia sp. CF038]|uniref:DUF2141 domain-containing protein n=1 Tax=Massilia sp. CF038 TaxID=1881045 RepID=UPI00091A5E30|nr:DUF2141 domain-containing protein [Massilia sp. CF038]SHH00035.1 Uncharacterized conserved protein, DUF2141 family [Massilia sp. CF038]